MTTTTPITSTTTTPAAPQSTAQKATAKLNTDFNDFLTLLTTQLKNQDPTAPMDTNQFTQNIVQYTGVQQQVQANTNLEKLISLTQASQRTSAAAYVGKTVEAEGNAVELQNGMASLSYELPSAAKDATVTIQDSKGSIVFKGDGLKAAGRNEMIWDGSSSFSSNKAASGNYTYTITATDTAGKMMTPKTYTIGTVQSVDMTQDSIQLQVAGSSIGLDKVLKLQSS